jgi:hypothetical protein
MSIARTAIVLLACVCAGCAGGSRYASHWDGRRGYDGNGDYGYDLAAARSEAGSYQARAARFYPAPGTPDDPWGPNVREAATRFQVPERWIRAVMRQESGGRLYDPDGSLITSSAGAMGLMQVMPRTYDMLRQRYGLGSDPYEPHDNILAGAAYIREMFDRYGSPAFLAAYNAGPDRLDAYLSGGSPLPDETVNYLASVAPRLGAEVPMSGPLAVYAGGAGPAAVGQAQISEADDPSVRAFDGGGLVTPDAPTGMLTAQSGTGGAAMTAPLPERPGGSPVARPAESPFPAPPVPAPRPPAIVPVAAPAIQAGDWGIQVGAYPDPANSARAIAAARAHVGDLLAGAQPAIMSVQRGGILYRARLVGLSAGNAAAACAKLSGQGIDCFTVPPGS